MIQPTVRLDSVIDHPVTASRKRGERVTRKPRVVTFRLDQATWDFMREIVPYTRYRNTSSFIRAAHPYLPQSQTLRIIFATACQETFFSSPDDYNGENCLNHKPVN